MDDSLDFVELHRALFRGYWPWKLRACHATELLRIRILDRMTQRDPALLARGRVPCVLEVSYAAGSLL